ncbi:DUF1799 domain-containing protein [Paracoccus lutimaris]|uniref:Uncharacterized protein DUF1799 n=1 Tax=Paracoccus lutimaris TaxID=1490030 RepID=A0A368YGS1_9RHOB|nr:DUF1799 domain-containing protein [Paracoccus lutimaris]RCW78077.1 uncharacterized protein DUF1799 [Paracoccus lutimaris]
MDDDLAAQFARMGVTVERPEAAAPDAFEVMRANAEAIEAWLGCETQWRCISAAPGSILWLGLDYGAVDVVLRRGKWTDPDQLMTDLQVMEGAALDVMHRDGK